MGLEPNTSRTASSGSESRRSDRIRRALGYHRRIRPTPRVSLLPRCVGRPPLSHLGPPERSEESSLGPPERSEGGRSLPAEERGREVGGSRSHQDQLFQGRTISPYLRPYSGRRYLPPALSGWGTKATGPFPLAIRQGDQAGPSPRPSGPGDQVPFSALVESLKAWIVSD